MKESDLRNVWYGCDCQHHVANIGMYGLSATLQCQNCGGTMSLRLRFGRPKTFEAHLYAKDMQASFVGYASVEAARDFIGHTGKNVFLPQGGADPEGESPIRDVMMLAKLLETLHGDGPIPTPQKRFDHVWSSINCDHKYIRCQLYGNMISLECQDCASDITFKQTNNGKFSVDVKRLGVEEMPCGIHKHDKVFDFMRWNVTEIQIPETIADRMSEDPDRDARRLTRLIKSMESFGLLWQAGDEENIVERYLVHLLSAFNSSRREFLNTVKKLKRNPVRFTEKGKSVDARYGFERCWLTWPCWFESGDFDVVSYDATGMTGFCAKCGHSTLDDDDGLEYWEHGCRECGYKGYLLGIDIPPTKDDSKPTT